MLREIKPEKILAARGTRTRREVVEKIGFKISEQELFAYENNKYKPSMKKLPHLLAALGTTYEEISEPVELALV